MMNGMIDMTAANPYISKESNSKKRARSSPVPNIVPPKVPLNFKNSTLANMKAFATQQQRLQAIQQTRQQLQSQPPQQGQSQTQLNDDDQTMKSANSLRSAGSLLSGSTFSFYTAVDPGADDCSQSSSSSWSDSEDEDDGYEMYAPTANSGRGHLLRPMSLDQITALAVATGARKPSALQRNSFSQALLKQQPMVGMRRVQPKQQQGAARATSHRSASMPDIASQILHYRQMKGAQQSNGTSKQGGSSSSAPAKPDDRLKAILKAEGKTIEYCPYSSLNEFFLKVEPQHIQAFQQDVISAVRGKSVEDLKALAKEGKMLQCCNKFGESIVHMACRQSSAEVLEYLVTEANVNIRVCCDSGRTPLHDACWTTNPNFDTIKMLLKECPDFLKIKDKRGFSPLAYVPHGQWGQWGDFLEKNKDLLLFSELK